MSARGYGWFFLVLGLGWIGWMVFGWLSSDDIGRTYFPLAIGSTAPFGLGFLGLGIWLFRKSASNDRTPGGSSPPLKPPANRWRELPPRGN